MNQIKKKFITIFFVFLLLIGLFYTTAYILLIDGNIKNIAKNELEQTRKLVYVIYFSEPTKIMESSINLVESNQFTNALESEDFIKVSEIIDDTFKNGAEIRLLVDKNNNVKLTNLALNNSNFFSDNIIKEIVEKKSIISTTEKIPIESFLSYSEDIYWRSLVKKVSDYNDYNSNNQYENNNREEYNNDILIHFIFVPIIKNETVEYILIHGIVLNKNERIINKLNSYGINSAIYADDIVIASSFFTERNNMYTGIQMDDSIYSKVLKGEEFTLNEKFFFDRQYIMHLPLKNNGNQVIGSIVFSIDKSKYSYMKTFFGPLNIFFIALILLIIGIGGAGIMAYYFTKKFMKPMIKSFAEIIEGVSKEEGSLSDKIRSKK